VLALWRMHKLVPRRRCMRADAGSDTWQRR
jgi:hypothetical protein